MAKNYGGKGSVKKLPGVTQMDKTVSGAMPGPKGAGKLGHVGGGKKGVNSNKGAKAQAGARKDGCY